MNRIEFDALRKLPRKEIDVDICFVAKSRMVEEVRVFNKASVKNSFDLEILLNGAYDRRTGSTTFNFVLQGVGPICRVDVNGASHGDAGRTHKHELMEESDPRKDLPHAVARADFQGKTPREIWELLCKLANIDHTGTFVDP